MTCSGFNVMWVKLSEVDQWQAAPISSLTQNYVIYDLIIILTTFPGYNFHKKWSSWLGLRGLWERRSRHKYEKWTPGSVPGHGAGETHECIFLISSNSHTFHIRIYKMNDIANILFDWPHSIQIWFLSRDICSHFPACLGNWLPDTSWLIWFKLWGARHGLVQSVRPSQPLPFVSQSSLTRSDN